MEIRVNEKQGKAWLDWVNRHAFKIYILAIICSFGLGCMAGYKMVKHEAKTYIGTVIKKEYQPVEIKYEKQEEWVNGELKIVKKPEKYNEQFSFLLKDVFGSETTVFVTKEEYKQFEVGDKYRR